MIWSRIGGGSSFTPLGLPVLSGALAHFRARDDHRTLRVGDDAIRARIRSGSAMAEYLGCGHMGAIVSWLNDMLENAVSGLVHRRKTASIQGPLLVNSLVFI